MPNQTDPYVALAEAMVSMSNPNTPWKVTIRRTSEPGPTNGTRS